MSASLRGFPNFVVKEFSSASRRDENEKTPSPIQLKGRTDIFNQPPANLSDCVAVEVPNLQYHPYPDSSVWKGSDNAARLFKKGSDSPGSLII
ncbi:Hypothetical protein NTJ_09684 [Nesidiocoris tenuis]|uniref:Uncharacterized protein n=1 Tax=Nesidiocoris tenuis TaxID=355587 RepID=A0ABN7B135_9HEMI|nr:Hypothetical protein NTJ_09684 [Nesidiocoris tenuis]